MLALDVGGRLPLNCGGELAALLAHMTDEQTEAYQAASVPRLTAHFTQPDQIWQDILRTRKQGYTYSVEDVIEGVAAIGAPIRDHSDQVIGAISIAGLLQHFDQTTWPASSSRCAKRPKPSRSTWDGKRRTAQCPSLPARAGSPPAEETNDCSCNG
jgi:DNA-binding IclR family transcriptional regulator